MMTYTEPLTGGIDMKIKTEKELRSLYENRELITFVQGKEHFIKCANTYFKQFKTITNMTYEGKSWEELGFDTDFYRMCWELDNGYGEE